MSIRREFVVGSEHLRLPQLSKGGGLTDSLRIQIQMTGRGVTYIIKMAKGIFLLGLVSVRQFEYNFFITLRSNINCFPCRRYL